MDTVSTDTAMVLLAIHEGDTAAAARGDEVIATITTALFYAAGLCGIAAAVWCWMKYGRER